MPLAAAVDFQLPPAFHFAATFVFALTGALAACRRHYDVVGVFVLAFVAGVGGSLLRDGLFLGVEPPLVLRDWQYIPVILLASIAGATLYERIDRFQFVFGLLDAAGLADYSVIGTQMALSLSLPVPAAVLVGTVNAVGGGLLRDLLAQEEPILFQPSQFYALVAASGAMAFAALRSFTSLPGGVAGILAALWIFALRVAAIRYDWRTVPVRRPDELR